MAHPTFTDDELVSRAEKNNFQTSHDLREISILCSSHGSIEGLKNLKNKGLSFGMNEVIEACANGHVNVLIFLVKNGVTPSTTIEKGDFSYPTYPETYIPSNAYKIGADIACRNKHMNVLNWLFSTFKILPTPYEASAAGYLEWFLQCEER